MKASIISAWLLLLATTACLQKVNGASSAWRSLNIAVREKNLDLVKSLLANGVDAKATNIAGWSALMLAAKYGNDDMVQILLPKSDIKAANRRGYTALMYAAWSGNEKSVKLLLPKSDVKAKNYHGLTALDLAKMRKNTDDNTRRIITLLQEYM